MLIHKGMKRTAIFADFIKDLPPGFQPGVFVAFDIITLQQVSWHKYPCQFVMCLRLWFAFSLAEELHWASALIGT